MNIELMVSIWPTVQPDSENCAEMLEQSHLIRVDHGVRVGLDFQSPTIHYDATNPSARAFLWSTAKKNYHDLGIKIFWLDKAEPEYTIYNFDNYRYWAGPNVKIGNIYPVEDAKTFYEGMTASGQKDVVNLLRCAWAGSQKYGVLVWSGDIASSWSSLRNQLVAGLNMGLAGIPWWTTDIGGFHGGDPNDAVFLELFVCWFQWGTFCPVMRLHGDREPKQPQHGMTRGATCLSGADNEVWSYGEEVYEICKTYMDIREGLRDCIRELMREAHEKGTPLMRPLFYDLPEDARRWDVEDQYMFGPKYLCAPVLFPGLKKRDVYLPAGAKWKGWGKDEVVEGSKVMEVECRIEAMLVFEKV